jgi:hypothetical protein
MVPEADPPGLLHLGKLLVASHYDYFTMTATALLGISIGWHLRHHFTQPDIIRKYAGAGAGLVVIGILISLQSNNPGYWFEMGPVPLWGRMSYLGVTLLVLAGALLASRDAAKIIVFGVRPFHLLAATGILALPLFVGHEVVIPAKMVLEAWGVPSFVAISSIMGAFAACTGFLLWYVYRLYYGQPTLVEPWSRPSHEVVG